MTTEIYPDNDNVVEIDLFKDAIAGTFLNAGTVSCRILETTGTEAVATQAMSFVAASNGKYRVSLDKALIASLVDGKSYDVEITGVESGLDYREFVRVKFQKRRP